MSYQNSLLKAGVNPEDFDRCMAWAFGDDWKDLPMAGSDHQWNKLHEEIFTIYPFDDIDSTFVKIGKAWNDYDNKQ